MEHSILGDPTIYPEENTLEKILDKRHQYYKSFMEKTGKEKLIIEWNYYKDGKSWLCKITNKKKTVCWLSLWDTGIRLSFYFTEKTINGIGDLEMSLRGAELGPLVRRGILSSALFDGGSFDRKFIIPSGLIPRCVHFD